MQVTRSKELTLPITGPQGAPEGREGNFENLDFWPKMSQNGQVSAHVFPKTCLGKNFNENTSKYLKILVIFGRFQNSFRPNTLRKSKFSKSPFRLFVRLKSYLSKLSQKRDLGLKIVEPTYHFSKIMQLFPLFFCC